MATLQPMNMAYQPQTMPYQPSYQSMPRRPMSGTALAVVIISIVILLIIVFIGFFVLYGESGKHLTGSAPKTLQCPPPDNPEYTELEKLTGKCLKPIPPDYDKVYRTREARYYYLKKCPSGYKQSLDDHFYCVQQGKGIVAPGDKQFGYDNVKNCEKAHGSGNCEKGDVRWHKKCPDGMYRFKQLCYTCPTGFEAVKKATGKAGGCLRPSQGRVDKVDAYKGCPPLDKPEYTHEQAGRCFVPCPEGYSLNITTRKCVPAATSSEEFVPESIYSEKMWSPDDVEMF